MNCALIRGAGCTSSRYAVNVLEAAGKLAILLLASRIVNELGVVISFPASAIGVLEVIIGVLLSDSYSAHNVVGLQDTAEAPPI